MQGGVAALLYNGSAAGIFFGRAAWRVDSDTRVCRRGFILAVQDITIVCPEESLLLCSRVCQLCRKKIPCWGMTRRLRRGWWGCRPEGGSTFFRSERKYQRKHAARRLREKALYCPFLKEGVRNVARSIVGEITLTFVRARAHSFPLSKRARLFPSAAYRRSAPPQLAWGKLKWRCLGCSSVAGRLRSAEKQDYFFSVVSIRQTYKRRLGYFGASWIFSQRKRPAWVPIHAGLLREP